MARRLDRMITQLSVQLVYQSGRPLAELRPIVRSLFDQARREYLAADPPKKDERKAKASEGIA